MWRQSQQMAGQLKESRSQTKCQKTFGNAALAADKQCRIAAYAMNDTIKNF